MEKFNEEMMKKILLHDCGDCDEFASDELEVTAAERNAEFASDESDIAVNNGESKYFNTCEYTMIAPVSDEENDTVDYSRS